MDDKNQSGASLNRDQKQQGSDEGTSRSQDIGRKGGEVSEEDFDLYWNEMGGVTPQKPRDIIDESEE